MTVVDYKPAILAVWSWAEQAVGPENVRAVDKEPDADGIEITLFARSPEKQESFYIKFYITDSMMRESALLLREFIYDRLTKQYEFLHGKRHEEHIES